MISALLRLTAAALAVYLWPYIMDGLGRLIEYVNDTPRYEGPDDFWPVVGYFRFFGACTIFSAWIVRYFIHLFQIKLVNVLSYFIIFLIIFTIYFRAEKYSDADSFFTAIQISISFLSVIFIHDFFYIIISKVFAKMNSR